MAKLPTEKQSASLLLDLGYRCTRIIRQQNPSIAISTPIEEATPPLLACYELRKETYKKRQYALDDCIVADYLTDDILRNLGSDTKKYDRQHLTANTYKLCFLDQPMSNITKMNRKEQTKTVVKIIAALDTLGPEHELAHYSETLKAANDSTIAKIEAYEAAELTYELAMGAEVIERQKFCKAYSDAYFMAAMEYGKKIAERFFPRTIYSSSTKSTTGSKEETSQD